MMTHKSPSKHKKMRVSRIFLFIFTYFDKNGLKYSANKLPNNTSDSES